MKKWIALAAAVAALAIPATALAGPHEGSDSPKHAAAPLGWTWDED